MDDQGSLTSVNTTKALTSMVSQKQNTPRFPARIDAGKPPLLPTPTTVVNANDKPLAIKWISPAERQERLKKGLCFNCDNRWVRGHKCPAKFMLLMTDAKDTNEQETDVEKEEAVESGDISCLNSLVGHGSPRSLQLWGTWGNGQVHILIENGSTHNL